MSDADIILLSSLGTGLTEISTSVTLESLLMGVHFVLIVFAVQSLWKKPNGMTRNVMILTATIIALHTFVVIDGRSLLEKVTAYNQGPQNSQVNAASIIFNFEFFIGDCVVVWRALALWEMSWKAAVLPIVSLTANLAMDLYYIGCMATTGWHETDGLEPAKCLQAQKIVYFLSLGINALATLMIAARAWQLRRSLAGIGAKRRKTNAQQILLLLVESGAFYLIYWAAKSFAFFPGSVSGEASFFAQQVLFSLANVIVGLYPTIIIVLVHMKRTAWDHVEASLPTPVGLTEKNMVFAKRHQQFPSLATTTTHGGSVSDAGPDEGRV
ncbi:hypothetical protein CPB85DRAFT_1430397 [Mucidula mucida]|nr:hypothetical protein CPB85DRAFT_1430397 [Mucidula mucida]